MAPSASLASSSGRWLARGTQPRPRLPPHTDTYILYSSEAFASSDPRTGEAAMVAMLACLLRSTAPRSLPFISALRSRTSLLPQWMCSASAWAGLGRVVRGSMKKASEVLHLVRSVYKGLSYSRFKGAYF